MTSAPIGARTGAAIFGVMGTLWWVVGAGASESGVAGLIAVGVAVGVVVTVSCVRRAHNRVAPDAATMRTFNRINLAQALAILVCALLAGRLGHAELIAPVVAAIVGLHFLPLARVMRWSGYRSVGVGFLVIALVGAVMLAAGAVLEPVLLVTGLGCGVLLWVAAWGLAATS